MMEPWQSQERTNRAKEIQEQLKKLGDTEGPGSQGRAAGTMVKPVQLRTRARKKEPNGAEVLEGRGADEGPNVRGKGRVTTDQGVA